MRFWFLTTSFLGLALVTGCSAKPVPTKGVVIFKEKPLANATVVFHSQEPDGKSATGQTDAQGQFELTTSTLKDGAMPGEYKVTIQYQEPLELPPGLKSPQEIQEATAKARASHKPSIELPEMYTRVDQTPLRHHVPSDGEARFLLQAAPP
jgi:hypothetical protein